MAAVGLGGMGVGVAVGAGVAGAVGTGVAVGGTTVAVGGGARKTVGVPVPQPLMAIDNAAKPRISQGALLTGLGLPRAERLGRSPRLASPQKLVTSLA